jgi:hypothetical protein
MESDRGQTEYGKKSEFHNYMQNKELFWKNARKGDL